MPGGARSVGMHETNRMINRNKHKANQRICVREDELADVENTATNYALNKSKTLSDSFNVFGA